MKKSPTAKIGLGGGCHWCTEAVFQSLEGVVDVQQGYIASTGKAASFSEAIIIDYFSEILKLQTILEIHLLTHKSTSNHSFREKYRSAVYVFQPEDAESVTNLLKNFRKDFKEEIITQVLPFKEFHASRESLQNYYLKNPDKPFCQRYIHPKLAFLRENFSEDLKSDI